ncbi:uncharacterized protein Z520_00604 [Fonsecaea multimorphosa CBS 102226]|uniref:FAD/NAD(P)-binding domain-containing protein n=1 Tax=Fonsecaea multimorphosa CBS 102226 TaxID=1442371 RepID=A0A0D2J3H3_9EURO|nr:uncharacterized protein Z520_00604 [Fonsecaea multimorphosa CBS 102226]KIY03912.1 hypothetical protein Z520_00604 [Fonsecaea multimorphosa CBS 102226]OAL31753.1 hypothetical protein AYO22_00623 [Fonsecaea multimorphosa]
MAELVAADYLVVGAGAMGMAFVDTLLAESRKTIIMIDRYARPGGHWTTAYPFVRLHQPAAMYGVNSTRLERDGIEEFGWNKGLADCSSRDDVCAYFERVMKKTFLPSGRLQYFPKCDYIQEGKFRSILTGKTYRVAKDTCIVDATYSQTVVPSMRPPPYDVASGVDIVTPNELPEVSRGYEGYTVVGGGKTSMDACLWLLENGINASQITWIRPRDSYLLDRSTFQPGPQLAERAKASTQATFESLMAASSVGDFLKRQAAKQLLLQLDEKVTPTMFHCATVSQLEFEALKEIKSVVRKGHVTCVTRESVALEHGSYKPIPDTLYIDCSAGAIPKVAPVTVFRSHNITLQPVRYCQQTFSAALIAHVEATYEDAQLKNELCGPVPMPNEPIDYPLITLQTNLNTIAWLKQPQTVAWLRDCRLNIIRSTVPDDPEQRIAYSKQTITILEAANKKIQQLLDGLPEIDAAKMRTQLKDFHLTPARL